MIARLQAWGIALIAVCTAVLVAFGWGRWRGAERARKSAREQIVVGEQRALNAERVVEHSETRSEVDTLVLQLPSADAVPVGDAAADSAAARLRDEWSRD
ncbi:hypothetical protein GLA29479_3717 [Lysobacter antibioticus]|uniref:hypothetical protein n=1 Tax=Lysobacter antibioticus TaxID=84531 RepID=UPI000720CEAF|nr:hypothetical protein [Lysobacter antibioticus]ALN64568.1 hypothetical protein GLA29479_3717 [Lysobacter antibioticus]